MPEAKLSTLVPVRLADELRIARALNWQPIDGNPSLIGRATIAFAGERTVAGIPIVRRGDGTLSCGVPSCPILAADGAHQRDADGKRRYAPFISLADREARARSDCAILAALADAGITGQRSLPLTEAAP